MEATVRTSTACEAGGGGRLRFPEGAWAAGQDGAL